MDASTVEIVMGGVFGLVTAGASGVAAVGVSRLLKHTDELKGKVDEHGVSIAEMKLKLPNGEWRAIKADVAEVGAQVTALRGEVGEHILACKKMTGPERVCRPRIRPKRARGRK